MPKRKKVDYSETVAEASPRVRDITFTAEESLTWSLARESSSASVQGTVIRNLEGERVAGRGLGSLAEVTELLEEGLSKEAVHHLAEVMAVPLPRLLEAGRIAPRTFDRRASTLTLAESEGIMRVALAFHHAVETFENLTHAREWFRDPAPALGQIPPFAACRTEVGAQEVHDLLGRLEHGVYW